jgi:histidinol dehydrogenase
MLRSYRFADLDAPATDALLQRPRIDLESVQAIVDPIIADVRARGDAALIDYALKFDKATLRSTVYRPRPTDQIPLDPDTKAAFELAYRNIRAFHEAQRPAPLSVETMPGVVCRRDARPIQRVGLYVPGGTAILPSSVLMLGVPAQVAGCRTVVIATPPRADGSVSAEVEFAAALCGVDRILLAGGAQAVAALAYGTDSVPKVDKILGPGNQYVTAAKMRLQNSDAMISIDMPAGPSEVLVIADAAARPDFVAADLLSQAEHGADSQVVLVAVDGFDLPALHAALDTQLNALPRRQYAELALKNSFIVTVPDTASAMDFSNRYAPEHLILNTSDAEALCESVENAGSVFIGNLTPESVGDYASGTNHTLPTYGYARMYSGVSLDSYLKQITFQALDARGLRDLGPAVIRMAETEGLEAHAAAVRIRLATL